MDPRAAFPLTLRHLADALGGDVPDAETGEAFARKVCDAFARGTIPDRAVRDLARYESYLAELTPGPRAPPGELPRAPVRLAPHVRLLTYGADLPGMLRDLRAERPATPRAAHGWVVLRQDADGALHERWLRSEEGWTVESFREPTAPDDVLEDEEDRALIAALWRDGILVPA